MRDYHIESEVLAISGAAGLQDMGARYEGYLHSKDREIYIPIIEYVDIKRDYNAGISDFMTISFLLPLGDFVHGFYPDRDNLEIELIYHTVGKVVKQRFKLLIMEMDKGIEQKAYSDQTIQELNKNGMTNIIAQCLSKTIEQIRDTTVYGVYKKATVGDVISLGLNDAMGKIDIFDFNLSRNIDIIPPNNNRVYEQILIPDTVHALDLPSYLQHGDYGVYNGGIGTYVQVVDNEETVFVYPLYRKDNYQYTKNKLEIIAVSSATISSVDCTYGMSDDVLKILVTSLSPTSNKGAVDLKNKGVGVEYTEAEAIMKRPVKVSEDKIETAKDNLKRTYIHKNLRDGSTKKEQYTVKTNGYDVRSSVLKSDSKFIQVEWHFSNARLLTPGMGLTYIVEEDGGVKFYKGTLQGVHISTDNNRKIEVAVLMIAVELEPTSNRVLNSTENSGALQKMLSMF